MAQIMRTHSPPEDRDSSPQDQEQTEPIRRSKRRKYTAVACAECRRRKLKCIPSESDSRCERCVSKGHTTCDYDTVRRENAESQKSRKNDSETIEALRQDVQSLRDMLTDWISVARRPSGSTNADFVSPRLPQVAGSASMASASTAQGGPSSVAPDTSTVTTQTPRSDTSLVDVALPRRTTQSRSNRNAPQEPRFIGPTRSAYSLEVSERALSRLGIPKYELPPPSGQQSPAASPPPTSTSSEGYFWERCDSAEFIRMITVFQEEVESVYPCFQTGGLIEHAAEVLELGRMSEEEAQQAIESGRSPVSIKELHMAKLAVATTIVSEGHGKSETSTKLVEPVEHSVLSILKPSREIIDLQLLIALSIYYFYLDEDLLAWRTIGMAAREALVMGLHRKPILMETYRDKEEQNIAVRVFWTIYVLDRRWSFGTSLSFALADRDIDAELPEPHDDCPYLHCMVGYGRLCTALWDALIPFGDRSHNGNPDAMTEHLDLKTQEWLESIPNELRLSHPRLGLAARAQPPVLQRVRAMLYLRGNHSRILIYRYYLLGPERIKSYPRNAWLAVEIAQDSIHVLVHLNESSDIYRRQQAMFNYFLLSALAVLFLAVCNDPETFAGPCKRSLHSAIDLLRYFSKHSLGSRRLWSSIRGIVARLRRLEMIHAEEKQLQEEGEATTMHQPGKDAENAQQPVAAGTTSGMTMKSGDSGLAGVPVGHTSSYAPLREPTGTYDAREGMYYADGTQQGMATAPGFSDVGDDLINLYEIFEQGRTLAPQMDLTNFWANGIHAPSYLSEDPGDLQFNWLVQ